MTNTSPLPAIDDRRAPAALWALAYACLATLRALFGAPRDVAAAGWLARRTRNLLRFCLNATQAVVARLLLIEAAALPAPAPTVHRARKPQPRRLIEHRADAPEHWRVALRLHPYRRLPAGNGSRRLKAGGTKRDRQNAWPLAERYEAILRACAAPAPYVRRLARRLHAAPNRADAILSASAPAARLISADAHAALSGAAQSARDIIATCIRAPPRSLP